MYMRLMTVGIPKYSRDFLVPEASVVDVEMVIEKLNRHTSSKIHQIPAKVIQASSEKKNALRSLNLLIVFGIRRK
jgi:hypothetical protein